jgi:hypothetical protein
MCIRDRASNAPYVGASLRDIQRDCARGLCKRELDILIESLIISEEIGVDEYVAKNKKTVKYFFIPKPSVRTV